MAINKLLLKIAQEASGWRLCDQTAFFFFLRLFTPALVDAEISGGLFIYSDAPPTGNQPPVTQPIQPKSVVAFKKKKQLLFSFLQQSPYFFLIFTL